MPWRWTAPASRNIGGFKSNRCCLSKILNLPHVASHFMRIDCIHCVDSCLGCSVAGLFVLWKYTRVLDSWVLKPSCNFLRFPATLDCIFPAGACIFLQEKAFVCRKVHLKLRKDLFCRKIVYVQFARGLRIMNGSVFLDDLSLSDERRSSLETHLEEGHEAVRTHTPYWASICEGCVMQGYVCFHIARLAQILVIASPSACMCVCNPNGCTAAKNVSARTRVLGYLCAVLQKCLLCNVEVEAQLHSFVRGVDLCNGGYFGMFSKVLPNQRSGDLWSKLSEPCSASGFGQLPSNFGPLLVATHRPWTLPGESVAADHGCPNRRCSSQGQAQRVRRACLHLRGGSIWATRPFAHHHGWQGSTHRGGQAARGCSWWGRRCNLTSGSCSPVLQMRIELMCDMMHDSSRDLRDWHCKGDMWCSKLDVHMKISIVKVLLLSPSKKKDVLRALAAGRCLSSNGRVWSCRYRLCSFWRCASSFHLRTTPYHWTDNYYIATRYFPELIMSDVM